MKPEDLAERIDARVDAMVAAGVLEEVADADRAGASRTARAAIGFEELLAGDVDAVKRAQLSSRGASSPGCGGWRASSDRPRRRSDDELAQQIVSLLDDPR